MGQEQDSGKIVITRSQLERVICDEGVRLRRQVDACLPGSGNKSVSAAFQDVVIHFFEKIDDGTLQIDRYDPDAIIAILFVAVKRQAINRLKRKNKWHELPPDAPIGFYEDTVPTAIEETWARVVSSMPGALQQVASLMFDFKRDKIERTNVEMAKMLGTSKMTVGRTKLKIRDWLLNLGADWFLGEILTEFD